MMRVAAVFSALLEPCTVLADEICQGGVPDAPSALLQRQSLLQRQTPDPIGICVVVPLSNPELPAKYNETDGTQFTLGKLAASVLETWGAVRKPDTFQLAFPNGFDLKNFVAAWMPHGDSRLSLIADSDNGPTFPQRPSPLRIFQALRYQHLQANNASNCSWFMSADIDGYVNLDVLRKQLLRLDYNQPILMGRITPSSYPWAGEYGYENWTTGALGHLISKNMLEVVDWGMCLEELQRRRALDLALGEGGVVGIDDVETGACIHRHVQNPLLQPMVDISFTQEHKPNARVTQMIHSRDPLWAHISAAHRMTPTLNHDAQVLLQRLSG